MKFRSDRKVQPELVASKDTSRPVLTNVHLDVDKSQVVVTDSYMLARFPVELDEGDTSGPIPVEALKASRKPPSKFGEVAIKAGENEAGEKVDVTQNDEAYLTVPRDDFDYQYPDADKLFPEPGTFTVGLNPHLLVALAKAIGCDGKKEQGVALTFTNAKNGTPNPLRPITVRLINNVEGDADGILMPIRVSW